MRRALDTFGAEVIVPLHARGRIIGWLFFGHRFTGQPFDHHDLENLMLLAEHVSTVLENALLHEEITLQKTLAETLLKSHPPGDRRRAMKMAIVRWFNPTAELILGIAGRRCSESPSRSRRQPDRFRSCAKRWKPDHSLASRAMDRRPTPGGPFPSKPAGLWTNSKPLGAVAVVHDMTAEE